MISLTKEARLQRKRIIWIPSIVLDLFMHKTAYLEILKHLAERGNDVYLFTARSEKNLQILHSNIHLILIPLKYVKIITNSLFALIAFIFLPFYIAIKRPDFIVTEAGTSVISFIWKPLLHPLRFKVILDIRSTPLRSDSFLNILLFNISVAIAKKISDGITVLTSLMKREICYRFQIDPEFIEVWTSGVSTALFKPEKYNRMQIRKKLGLADKFIVFYHGIFSVHRGIIESIKSIEILKNKYPNLVLFLLGSGPALPILEKSIQEKDVQGNVLVHSPVDYVDVPKYIAMCDVAIVPLPDLPDWRHQCPLKLLEYLAMKKVVIVTDIPANREVIGRSKCGIYISSVNPMDIAKAIMYAYNNKEQLKEWGSYGRAIIKEKYSWKKVAEDLENYLLKC